MAIKAGRKLTEADLYAPDLDDGFLNVEHYPLPGGDGIEDQYLRTVWEAAVKMLLDGDERLT